MKARIFCHDAPEFPAHRTATLSESVTSTRPTPSGAPHHPHHPWAHCEILPESGPQGKGDLAGAVLFGLFIGILLCAIPLFILLRKVRRLRKMGRMHHGHHGHHGRGGRRMEHGPHHGFPEYEAELLLKHEYEAPLDY
ncbi:hypothetical protein C8R44DRAFT_884688 [Mycena epipterygia]|nr:hypothetical protein C8R44DRAFT_884688 [Mycena epipterygia]